MSSSVKDISFHIFLLLGVCYFSFFYRLGERGLTDPDEGRYAEAAREMIIKGDYITPWLNDEPRLQKPILIYWLIIASYKLVGVSELGARLPSAIAATGTAIVLYFLCRALFNPLIGLLAGIIFALSPLTSAIARISNTDMTLTFFITASLASFATVYFLQRSEYLFFFYLALAFASLTKGYVGFFIPLIIIFIFLLSVRQLKFFRQLKLFQGLIIFLLINLPWYLMIILIHKEALRYYLVEEGWQRFFTTHHERQQPVYYYVILIIPAFFPWSLFLLETFIKQINFGLKTLASQFPRQFYFFIWYIVGLGVFSLSGSKLPTYIMPIFPALALTTALWCYANFFSQRAENFSCYKASTILIKWLLLIILLTAL
ncbi:MAG: glycosyltransferase family 39 protein [Candidatus Sumerlaeia bacterium]|nr:glycosyltransferase family 39 protein [Candidatus Sumerlaeia bacterium]